MSSELQTINEFFDNKNVYQTDDGNVWVPVVGFLRDVLGYAKPHAMLKQHDIQAIEFRKIKPVVASGLAPLKSSILMVTEADIHRILTVSSKPICKTYQDWIFGTLLPTVRKQGYYSTLDVVELDQRIRDTKATRESIDLMFKKLVEVSYKILQTEYTRKGATVYIANVMDAVYQVSLLKTASYIKVEQIMKGGSLELVTTNQLRDKEAEWRIDFTNAINYLNDEELEQVKLTMQTLITSVDNLSKRKFVTPSVALVKNQIAANLVLLFNGIDDQYKEEHKHQLMHFKGIKELMDDISRRHNKFITVEDQEMVNEMPTRKAPFMN